MTMHCGISGEVCEEPVLAKGSGVVYEKRVILKYIESEGKDPATGEELTADDLLPIKTNKVVRPRPVSATSVPGLLAIFQNEWDALMLETFTLKEHLATTRTELANALYQHDAACRVIARLVRERDEAQHQLSALQSQFAQRAVAAGGGEAMEVEEMNGGGGAAGGGDINRPIGVSDAVLAEVTAKWEALSKQRKKRPLPEDLAGWACKEEHAPHATAKPGVLALDILPSDSSILVTGGADKDAIVYNRKEEVVVDRLKGHSKKVNAVLFHPAAPGDDKYGLVLTGSADKSVRLWKPAASGGKRGQAAGKLGKYSEVACLSSLHTNEVTALSIQPTGNFFASASKDKSWAFCDLATGQALAHVADPSVGGGYEALAFHPDGVLLGTGTAESKVRMWDLKTQANVATFEEHSGPVKGLAFSENGYYMASGSADGTVQLWDLRKLKSIQSIDLGDAVNAVTFDPSGQYLGVAAGKLAKVFLAKEWSPVAEYADAGDKVTALRFAAPASAYLATASMDRTVRIYQ